MWMLIDEAESNAQGADLARKKILRDPAFEVAETLGRSLARRFSLTVVEGQSDLVLEVTTSSWGYYPAPMGGQMMMYDGTLKLKDARNSAILADAICTYRSALVDEVPSKAELLEDDGALLRAKVEAIRSFCAEDYRTRILGLYQ